jgi:hypothetical protein
LLRRDPRPNGSRAFVPESPDIDETASIASDAGGDAEPSPISPQKKTCSEIWKKTFTPLIEMRNPTAEARSRTP